MQEKRVESISEVDMSGLKVPMIAAYKNPSDFPGEYVARIYDLDKPTDTIVVKQSIEEIAADIQENTGMVFIPRGAGDVPELVGVWI